MPNQCNCDGPKQSVLLLSERSVGIKVIITAPDIHFEQAASLFQSPQMDHLPGAAKALNHLGFVAWSQGLYEDARNYHEEACRIFRRVGNRQGEGNTLSYLRRVVGGTPA